MIISYREGQTCIFLFVPSVKCCSDEIEILKHPVHHTEIGLDFEAAGIFSQNEK